MNSVIVPDHHSASVLEWALSIFLFSAALFLIAASAWLAQSLLVYRACGWVFWSVPDALPVCLLH